LRPTQGKLSDRHCYSHGRGQFWQDIVHHVVDYDTGDEFEADEDTEEFLFDSHDIKSLRMNERKQQARRPIASTVGGGLG